MITELRREGLLPCFLILLAITMTHICTCCVSSISEMLVAESSHGATPFFDPLGGAAPRSTKSQPPSLDVFGWCTWDAFYSSVSARGLSEGLASLVQGGVQPRLLIIDDGWQVRTRTPPVRIL